MKFDYQYTKLKNGVRVLKIPMPGVESTTSMILVRTGSRNETDKQLGISHILEHMLFKGTKSYPSPMALAEVVDEMGAINNAFTGKEYTGYYITHAARHAGKAMKILSSMLAEPLIPAEDLKREREVIVEEINMYEDHPMERSAEEFENLLYEGSKMGRLIIGSKETVREVEKEHLEKYMQRWYNGGNLLVILAGKVEEVDLSQLEGLKKGEMEQYVEKAGYGQARRMHIKKETEQAHFVMGVPALSMTDPKRYPLQLAQVVLGGNMSSRLFNEIREKRGLAYYVKAQLETNSDVGQFIVRAGVKLEKLAEAQKVVKEEMLKLGETLTEKELKRAKEYLLGKLPLTLDTTMEVAQWMGLKTLVNDEVRQPSEAIEAVRGVEMEEVREVMRELVKEDEIRTCVVGPKAK